MAVKKSANAVTAAQVRALSSRSHRLTNVRQFCGGALGCQVRMAWLMGAVPRSVSKKLVSTTSSPAPWPTKRIRILGLIFKLPDPHYLLRGVENLVHRLFGALHNILWEQTEAITQPWPDLGDVRNDLLELCLETILLALRETTFHALIELLHRGSQRV